MKNPNLSSRAGVVHTLAKTTLLCFLSACAIGWLATSANAVGRGWTGSASGNWSNPNNWDPVGTPQDGEDLYFDISAVFFSPDPMFNDLTNLAVRSLYFSANADIITVDWELSGNTLDIAHDITLSASTTEHVYINCGFRLVGNTKFDVDWSTDGSELHVNGPMDLNGHNLSLIADQNCLLEVSGVVSGTGDINVNVNPQGGPIGTVRLSGTQGNTFLGTVTLRDSPGAFGGTIGSGLLLNKQSGVAVPDRLVLEQNCRVGLGAPQQIGDNAPVSLGGGSRFLLNGNNETIGNLILTNSATDTDATVVDIGGGTLTLLGGITSGSDGGSVIPTVTGRLGLAAGGHVFDIGGVSYAGLDLQAQIAGLGGFSKFGRAALLLQTNNTFTGGVSVNAGILDVRHNSALGATSSGTTLLGSGTLTLRNATIAGETLFVRGDAQVTVNTAGSLLFTIGNCSWTGPIELDTNLVLWADNTTLSGPISGVGGMDFQNGTAIITGPAANTYAGATRVLATLVEFNKAPAIAAFSGPLIVGDGSGGGTLEARWLNNLQGVTPGVTVYPDGLVNLNNHNENFGALNFHGGDVETGTGLLSLFQTITSFADSSTAVINGKVQISTGNQTFDVADGSANPDLTVNAIISDSSAASLTKQGAGELLLYAANTYHASTFIQGGVLIAANDLALGTTTVGTAVSDGATLELDGRSQTFAEGLNLSGNGRGGTNGAIYSKQGGAISSFITLDAPSTIRCDDTSGQFLLTSKITGSGPLTKTGAGILTLGGSTDNTCTGGTLANEGYLWLAKPNGINAVTERLIIGTSSGLGLGGTVATVANLQSDAIAATNITVNGGSLYNLNNFNESVGSITLNNGGNVRTGVGSLSLSQVTVNPGNFGASVISGRLFFNFGCTFTVGQQLIGNPLNPAPALDLQAGLSDGFAGNVIKNGFGDLRLSASNSFNSAMIVNEGELVVSNAFGLGTATGGTIVNSNAILMLDGGGLLINNEALTLNSGNPSALYCRSGSNTWTAPITLSQTAGLNVASASGYLQAPNTVSGAGGLTKIGPGTVQFWGSTSNNYTGLTTVSEGVLDAGRAGLVSIPGDVVIGDDSTTIVTATLRSLRDQQLKTGANVALHSSGVLDLSQVNAAVHPIERVRTITGSGLVQVSLGSRLIVSNDVPFEFFGAINGAGSFTKNGPATMTMWGDWSLVAFGSLDIFGGDLMVHGNIDSVTNSVRSGARLRGDGKLTGPSGVAAGGSLAVDSKFPDHQGGDLELGSLRLISGPGTALDFDLYGPSATGGNDKLVVAGSVQLSTATVSANFLYPPREGDVITLLEKTSAGAISGSFNGNFSSGLHKIGNIPVLVSYTGGDGNDLTLTVTNLASSYSSYRLTDGNGNQTVEPDECNLLYISLLNRRTNSLAITNASLRAVTSNAVVTIASAGYPTIGAGLTAENLTPFQFRTDPAMVCGSAVSFELVLDVVNEGEFAVTFSPVSGIDCTHPTGPCESCTVVAGQFATNTPTTAQPLYFVGAPSICYPPKACPGVDPSTNLVPLRYLTHSFTNATTNDLCITAQLQFDCPGAPTNSLGVAAYLGVFSPGQPCSDYLGDGGAGGPPYPAFSFPVPAGSNFVVVVTARTTNLVCGNYTLELFGLPCPPPTLAIARETAATNRVRVQWSTAYPGFTAQQAGTPGGTFGNAVQVPAIVNGRYALTNLTASTNQFFRLRK